MNRKRKDDDPSNKLLDLETQLRWLRELGFEDVDSEHGFLNLFRNRFKFKTTEKAQQLGWLERGERA